MYSVVRQNEKQNNVMMDPQVTLNSSPKKKTYHLVK